MSAQINRFELILKNSRSIMKINQIIILAYIAGITVFSGTVSAAEENVPQWKAEAELGFVKTTGNTQTESLNAKARVSNERQFWKHELRFETVRNEDSDRVTAERYFLNAKTSYKLNLVSYVFGRAQYEDDRFSGYDYQASLVGGYGYHIYDTEELKWNAELGGGMRENKFEDGTSETEAIISLATDVNWKISSSANLLQELTIDSGDKRTISRSVTALSTKINSSLSSKISYTVKHNSKVPSGTKKTDTETAITLVYAF